jgi:hypothetical protein
MRPTVTALRGIGGARSAAGRTADDTGRMGEEFAGPNSIDERFIGAASARIPDDDEISAVVQGPDGARLIGTATQLVLLHTDGSGGIVTENWSLEEVEDLSVVSGYVLVTLRSRSGPVAFPLDPDVEEADMQAVTVIGLQQAHAKRKARRPTL